MNGQDAPAVPPSGAAPAAGDFPWTWDQFQRYSVLAAFVDVFYSGRSPRLLDVGGLSPRRTGAGSWLPAKSVYAGNTVVLDIGFHPESGFVQGDACRLPFKTASFDVISALDVLEHIPSDMRENFISELARVSAGAILVSAPFQDPFIEKAEKQLFDEVLAIYGVEHRQLLEHRECGLPEPGAVSNLLGKALPGAAAAEFSYGSVLNWLYHQSFKNIFMQRRESEALDELMDRWISSRPDTSDFEPPFSRRFWAVSRAVSRQELNRGVDKIVARLKERRLPPPPFEDFVRLNRALTDFALNERVLSVVVTEGGSASLEACLAHLLTQKVDFTLEVLVWDLAGGEKAGPQVEGLGQKFPGLKFFSPRDRKNLRAALLEMGLRSAGRFILLLADDVLLPQNSVADFRNALSSCPDYDLLTPRVLSHGRINSVDYGKAGARMGFFGLGRGMPPAGPSADEANWVRSGCLFFRREALAGRRLKESIPSKKEIFLWEKGSRDRKILFAGEFIVHKRRKP